MNAQPRVYVVIVNWNGWRDTIECLESVFRCDWPNLRVVVCDNDSGDDSLGHIKAWAEGQIVSVCPDMSPLSKLTFPPVPKPVSCAFYDRAQAECGGDLRSDAKLVLVQTGDNLGFAGGNNVGLRYALARDNFEYVLLLNNDTVITPDSINRMVERMMEDQNAGMCGSTLLYYYEPDTVQALGGAVYSKWLGLTRHVGLFQKVKRTIDRARVEHEMDYVVAAAMMVSKPFLKDVGLMCEDYFLYYEEVDWTLCASGRYGIVYAPESVIYHKEGSSTGANSAAGDEKSLKSDYYLIRSRLMVTRKFFPYALPTVYLGLSITLARRIGKGQFWGRLRTVLRVALLERGRVRQVKTQLRDKGAGS